MRPRPDRQSRQDGDTEAERWRHALLQHAGMPPETARAVAHDDRYDLHEILGLLEKGCPPSRALEIAAPLEDRRTP